MISKVSTFLGPNGLYRSGATPSLVLSLDSTNSMSYNAPSQTWFDLSIRGNNGTLNDVNQALIGSSSNILTSLLFNGTGSYISFTQSDCIPLGNSNYTIETWFNSNSYEFLEQGPFVGWGTIGEDNKTNVFRLNGNGLYTYWWNNDLNIAFTGNPCPPRSSIQGKVSQMPALICTMAITPAGDMAVSPVKNRYGAANASGTDAVYLKFNPEYMNLDDIDREINV